MALYLLVVLVCQAWLSSKMGKCYAEKKRTKAVNSKQDLAITLDAAGIPAMQYEASFSAR